jgi:SAM-dependent methyltransferase
MTDNNQAWDEIYSLGQSSRYINEGDIGIYYRLPKFARMFKKNILTLDGYKVLEIGGGVGEMFENLSAKFIDDNFSYTITEYSPNAVDVLKKKYNERCNPVVVQADAEHLQFEDNSFDVVCAFDVQHHVSDPQKMAQEMLRVSRRHVFLCEPCGISLIRRITEMTKTGKRLGEKSYSPCKIRRFFSLPQLLAGGGGVNITPFYFFVPPKLKKQFMYPFIILSEIGQRIPFIRWQSQSMAIYIDLKNMKGD